MPTCYYGCTLCNRCGKLDRMRSLKPVERRCPRCGILIDDSRSKVCPECGAALPPPLPHPPGESSS